MENKNMTSVSELAKRISVLAEDFDTYEFKDNFENEEDSIKHIEKLLGDTKGQASLLAFCDDVLNTCGKSLAAANEGVSEILKMFRSMYAEALAIKDALNQMSGNGTTGSGIPAPERVPVVQDPCKELIVSGGSESEHYLSEYYLIEVTETYQRIIAVPKSKVADIQEAIAVVEDKVSTGVIELVSEDMVDRRVDVYPTDNITTSDWENQVYEVYREAEPSTTCNKINL